MAALRFLLLLAFKTAVAIICPPSFLPTNGCVLPNDPYVYIGQNVTLNCHTPDSNHSENLFFSWKNDVNISLDYQRVISPSTMQLNRPILESDNIPKGGVLFLCKDSAGTIMGSGQFLRVEYYPRSVYNWAARVEDWRNLTVTWETGDYINQKDIKLSVQWRSADTNIWRPCSKHSWKSCFLDNSIYNNSQMYHFNVNVTNTKKHNSTITEISLEPEDYVKPAPVSITSVELSSRCVTLQWRHSSPDSRPIIYRVAVLQDHSEVINKTFTTTTGTVCNLRPNTLYTFRVTARSEHGGFWSDADQVINKTLQDKPERGVNITAGSFFVGVCEGNVRNVTIFLKPPDEEYQNGQLHIYTAVFEADDGSPNITVEQLVSQDPTLSIFLPCDVDYRLHLSVNNSVGFSPVSLLHIPRLGTVPSLDTVRVSVNGSSVQVLWIVAANIQARNFTIYWCLGDTRSVHCNSPPLWQTVDGSRRSLSLPVPADVVSTYLFGVSMATNEGSSGMKLSECVFDVNKAFDSNLKPQIDEVSSKPNLGLTVKWSMPVCHSNLLVKNYIVQLCRDNTTQHCVNRTTNSDEKMQVFDSLEESHNYTVRLQEISLAGYTGPVSDPVFGVPLDSALKPGWIAFVAIAAILIPVIIVGFAVKKCKERDPIKMPGTEKQDVFAPPLPIRTITLEVPDDQQRLSTDSGQGSPGSDLTSSLMPSLDSGQCDQMTSGQTEMTDLSGSCLEIVVLSSSSGCPQEQESMSDESDVPPYVTADVQRGVVNQALVSSNSESSATAFVNIDTPNPKTNQNPKSSNVNPYMPLDEVGKEQERLQQKVKPVSFVSPYTPVSAVNNIRSEVNQANQNSSASSNQSSGTESSVPSYTTVGGVDSIHANHTFSHSSGTESSVPSSNQSSGTESSVPSSNQSSGTESSVPSYTTVGGVDSIHANQTSSHSSGTESSVPSSNQSSGTEWSVPSYTTVAGVDSIHANQTSNHSSGTESSVPSYTTVTAVDKSSEKTNQDKRNPAVDPYATFDTVLQNNSKDHQMQHHPPYTTMDIVDKQGRDDSKKPVGSADNVAKQTTGKALGNPNYVAEVGVCDKTGAFVDEATQQTTGGYVDQRALKNMETCPEPDMSANVPTQQTTGGYVDQRALKNMETCPEPDMSANVPTQQTTGGYVDQRALKNMETCPEPDMSANVPTQQTTGGYVDQRALKNMETCPEPDMSANVPTQQTTGGYVDQRALKNMETCPEPDMSANVPTQQTTGQASGDNESTCDKPCRVPGMEMDRLDRCQGGAVQNGDYATLAQVGFLGKQISQDTEVTKF